MRDRRDQAGVAHLLVVVLVVVAGVLIVSGLLARSTSLDPVIPDTTLAKSGRASVDVAAIAPVIDASVVDITADLAGGRGRVAGTGLLLDGTGSVLTNNHVIANTTSITARVAGAGRRFSAQVTGYDVADDIAVLHLDAAAGLRRAPLAGAAPARVGDGVVVIGNAQGLGGTPRATAGAVAAVGQRVTATDDEGFDRESLSDMIEVTASVQPGDSGGALVDAHGRVVGLVTAASAGRGFAIPISRATAVANEITAGRSSSTVHAGPRAILGVAIKTLRSDPNAYPGVAGRPGAVVGLVNVDSPARAAGLRGDDVIVAADGRVVTSAAELNAVLDRRRPGDVVTLRWIDTTGHFRTASVQLVAGPPL